MDISNKFPIFTVIGDNWKAALSGIAKNIQAMRNEIAKAIATKQDVDDELDIKYYSQNGEPTLATNENACFWEDADGGPRYYLVLKNSSGTQIKVELT